MLCCAVGVAAVAAGAIGWRREARLLSDSGALSLCRGSAPADRITDTASIEE